MSQRDQVFDTEGNEIAFKQWPDDGNGGIDPGGMIDDYDGTLRPLDPDELAEWKASLPNVAERTGIDSFRDQDPRLAVAMGLMVMDMETVRNALGYLLQGAAAVNAAETREAKIDATVTLLEGFPAVFPALDARAVVDMQLIDNAGDAQDGLMELRVADKRTKADAFLSTPEGAAHAAAKAAELKGG